MCPVLSYKENKICLTAQPDGDTIIYLLFYSKQCKFYRSVNTTQISLHRNINSKDVP